MKKIWDIWLLELREVESWTLRKQYATILLEFLFNCITIMFILITIIIIIIIIIIMKITL